MAKVLQGQAVLALATVGLAISGLALALDLAALAAWLGALTMVACLWCRAWPRWRDAGVLPEPLLCQALDAAFDDPQRPEPACLVLRPDDPSLSPARLAAAILPMLRASDLAARVEGGLAVALTPLSPLDLEGMIPIAVRLQRAGMGVGSVSVGFCLPEVAPRRRGHALVQAASLAADEARRCGPAAIRSFRPGMDLSHTEDQRQVLETAFDLGQFVPHFQPQICARTGAVTGMEVLARWNHPEGLRLPRSFLDDIRRAGLSSRLTSTMLAQGLDHLRAWEAEGLDIPTLALNLDAQDLADPMLPDRILWEMDRHDLAPHRLTVEVMETVLADGDPVTARGIDRLARVGCGIDLDDFGTGQSAIAQLRRLRIRRIKIDRSLVTGLDHDADQRRMVVAILSLAEQLGLHTLAEGVESPAESALLTALGCSHLQGWAISPALPGDEVSTWVTERQRKLAFSPAQTRQIALPVTRV